MSKQSYNVIDTTYHFHVKPDGSSVVEVRYAIQICNGDRLQSFSEYLNFEHEKMKRKSAAWWRLRSPDPVPKTNQHAVDIANYHGVAITKRITVNRRYEITGYELGEIPPGIDEIW